MEKNGYKVIIASPVFGTGFSIDEGYVTHTFGFMFTYPLGNSNWIQMLARGRGPKFLGLYVEDAKLSKSSNVKMQSGRLYKVGRSWLEEKVGI